MKYTLNLNQTLPFASNVPFVELEDERILANNVIFPGEFNPHNVRLWVIGNEYGALGAVWADCESDAIDELIDSDLGGGILIDEADADEETARGGNAGEPYDTEHLWMATVRFEATHDLKLMLALAEARGACSKSLCA